MDRRALISALAVVATACTATGPSALPAMISKVDVARGASEQLAVQLQEAPAVIDCANALPRQVGAGQDCSEIDLIRGQRHAVRVRRPGRRGHDHLRRGGRCRAPAAPAD